MSYVIGNVAYIMTKHLSIGILEKTSWNTCIVLTDSSLNPIKFWKDSLPEVNVNQFTSDLYCQSIVYIDASNTGYGDYIVETSTNIAHDMWSKGSIKLELQDIALCIFKNCVQHYIIIDVEWVPRTNNEKADYINRIIGYDH
jgi:hypothetical protein